MMRKVFVAFLFLFFVGVCHGQSVYTADGSWTANTDPDIDHYDVSRGPQGGPYTLIVSVPHPATTFQEIGLSGPNCWILAGVNTGGISSVPTTEICIGVPGTPQGFAITFTVTAP